jgi:sulfite exporter TauE/SafE
MGVDGWLQAMLLTALVTGLLGGVHCAAMCGGIVGMTCTPGADGSAPGWGRNMAYHAGRIGSYVMAGTLAGAAGEAGLALRGGLLTPQILMLLMGVALLVTALNVAGFRPVTRGVEAAGALLWRQLQPLSRRFLPVRSTRQALGLGLVWGWLPCGMVYAVLLLALASGSAVQGAMMMAAFGLGTLPNLLLIGWSWRGLRARLPQAGLVRYVAATVIAAVGFFGVAHALHPAAMQPDSVLCLYLPGLAELLR